MPIISGLDNVQTRAANTVIARAFFPRAKRWLYPELAGSFTSVSKVEPMSLLGAAPPLQRFTGLLLGKTIPDYSQSIPNLLFKNVFQIAQSQFEFDQTGTVVQLAQQLGIRLAEFPDQLFCSRLLKGANPDDATVDFEGTTYSLTFDGKPFFHLTHPTQDGGNQSNIITGSHPSTNAAVIAQTFPTTAQQMQQDLMSLIDRVKTVKDTKGIPIYPTLDTKQSIVIVVPPILEPVAALAFRTGNDFAVVNQTTNVAPMFVKNVLSSGYLAGFPDPDTGVTVNPSNETDWYAFIVDDYVKPFYVQLFRPMRQGEQFPPGFNGSDVVNRVLNAVNGATVDQATIFASTRVDTTFRRIGADSDAHTIESEAFTLSARYRGNMVYGPWFTGYKIIPSGGLPYTGSSSSSSST